MQLSQSMSMRMDQRQILTPRMIQSMEILQLPLSALEERIEQEMAVNPTLDIRTRHADGPVGTGTTKSDNAALTIDPAGPDAAEFARLDRLADYLENEEFSTNANAGVRSRRFIAEDRDGKTDALANTAGRSTSLIEHLRDQWRLAEVPDDLRRAGEILIDYIEHDGYLRTSFDLVLEKHSHEVTREQLDDAIDFIQELDPPGICARDLSECLLLQLDALARDEELADGHDFDLERRLVRKHLKDLEQNRYPQISKAIDRPIDEIKDAVKRLARLSPAPGKAFAPVESPPVTPDAIVTFNDETRRYEVEMTRDPSHELAIRPMYRRLLEQKAGDKPLREFLAEKVRSARWLMDAIEQRRSTIARVIRIVVDAQQAFFEKGPEHLKPLPMIQVADMLGIHVATVSRAVSEKWIQTPVGLFPLRRFFSMGTTSADGTEMSWDAVKEKVRKIIDEEDKNSPLSDDEIAVKAKEQGIDLARRTVAKYRKILNIPTARQRKAY